MAKPYDATTKYLVENHPRDWIRCLGLPDGPTRVIDADLSTVTAEADRILRVEANAGPYLVHLEFQTSDDSRLAERMLRYNILVRYEHRLPVESVAILLRRAADVNLPGTLTMPGAEGRDAIAFRSRVLRVWEQSVESFLNAGLGTQPFAPLAASVTKERVPEVIEAITARLAQTDAPPDERASLWTAAYVLMGLRFDKAFTQQVLRGVQQMQDSVTYQAILGEGVQRGRVEGRAEGRVDGRVDGLREAVLLMGRERFGEPDAAVLRALSAVQSPERLDALMLRLLRTDSWSELLAQ